MDAAELHHSPNGVASPSPPDSADSMHPRVCRPVKDWLISVSALGCIAWSISLAGCGGGAHADTAPASKPNEPPVLKAAVLAVQPASWPTIVRTQGSLIADEVAIVGAKVGGRVKDVNFDLGDQVEAQAVLATLDQDDFKLEVALSEAQLFQSRAALGLGPYDPLESLDPENAPPVREAKAVWDETRTRVARVRQLQLHARNTVTQEELDQAIAAEGAAAARHAAAINAVRERIAQIHVRASELKVAQQRLVDTVVHAPFAGLVQERHVSHGSFLQLGDPIATLVRTGMVRFHGTMPERHAHRLELGQKVVLKIEGIPLPREVTVSRISPTVEEMSRSLAFEALVPNANGELRTGLFAEAIVVVDPGAQSLVVPRSAIIEFAGAEKVWKIVGGLAKEQLVQTARRDESVVEVTGGLTAGDQILVDAVQGRVARIEPIFQASAPREIGGGESSESAGGEDVDPLTQVSAPAVAPHERGVAR
jgi:membrane fusion protein, multidrug efflux system